MERVPNLLKESMEVWVTARVNRDLEKRSEHIVDQFSEIFHDFVCLKNVTEM